MNNNPEYKRIYKSHSIFSQLNSQNIHVFQEEYIQFFENLVNNNEGMTNI